MKTYEFRFRASLLRRQSKIRTGSGLTVVLCGSLLMIGAALLFYWVVFAPYLPSHPDSAFLYDNFQIDALTYRAAAMQWLQNPRAALLSIVAYVTTGHYMLNWITISIFGAATCSPFPGQCDWSINIVNSVIFLLTLMYAKKTLDALGCGFRPSHAFAITLLVPSMIFQIIGLNKEIIEFCVTAAITYYYITDRTTRLIVAAVIGAAFKIQFILILVLLLAKRFTRLRMLSALIILSLVRPFFHVMNLAAFYQSHPGIHSQALMTLLANIEVIPFGLLVVSPMRNIINLVAPVDFFLNPNFGIWNAVTAATTLLGLALSVSVLWSMISGRLNGHPLTDIVKALLIVNGLIPFLQPRYYFGVYMVCAMMLLTARSYQMMRVRYGRNLSKADVAVGPA